MKTFQLSKQTSPINSFIYLLKLFVDPNLYRVAEFKTISILVILISMLASFGYSQSSAIQLLPANETKIARVAPDTQTTQVSFLVDGGAKVKVHIRANIDNISVNIVCPNQQTVNPSNISGVNGTYNNYQIQQNEVGIGIAPDTFVGFHNTFQFPLQGTGTYIINFTAPSNITGDGVIVTDLSTDSSVSTKLFTSSTKNIVGKPVVLSLAVIDGQAAIGGATASGTILLPDGTSINTTLLDNGTGVDDQAGDGIYSAYYIPTLPGSYKISVETEGVTLSNTAFHRTSFVPITAEPFIGRLTGVVQDFGVDENSDNLFDKVVLRAGVETAVAGKYGVFVYLKTNSGEHLTGSREIQLDNIGINQIDVEFDAQSFVKIGEDGPYSIESIELIKYDTSSAEQLDSLKNLGQTQAYLISQFQRPPIIFAGSNQCEGIDFNNNGKYDLLHIKVGINVIKSGLYIVSGALSDNKDDSVDQYFSVVKLTAGSNYVSFVFVGAKINQHGISGIFKLKDVVIRELTEENTEGFPGAVLNSEYLLDTPAYDINQFETQDVPYSFTADTTATGIDLNSNGKFELLRIRATLYKSESLDGEDPGIHQFTFSLKDSSGNILQTVTMEQKIERGLNSIQFDFDSSHLVDANINGPLTVGDVHVYDYYGAGSVDLPVLFTTQPFNSNQFETGLVFTGNNTAQGIDLNSNEKYDLLRVQSELFATGGNYSIQASLKDPAGNLIQTINFTKNLHSGLNLLDLDFDGPYILAAGINGPLTISNVTVAKTNETSTTPVLYVTQTFNSEDFDRFPSNLRYSSYSLTPVTGDGDALFEPGETAQIFIKLFNNGNQNLSGVTASLSNISTNAEIITGNASYPIINSYDEKAGSSPFEIKLKDDASRHEDISFDLTFSPFAGELKTVNVKIQTGLLRKIAYVKSTSHNNLRTGQIYLMNSDGTSKTNISNSESDDKHPVFSPDGNKIAFQREGGLAIMNPDGTNQQLLTSIADNSKINWSSDGSKIAYENVVSGYNRDIYIIDINGGQPFHLTHDTQTEIYEAWIPNTNKIIFARGNGIYTINSDGTGESLLTNTDQPVYGIKPSPDGVLIAWIEGYGHLKLISASGGIKTDIANNVDNDGYFSWFDAKTLHIPVIRFVIIMLTRNCLLK